jgi:hypothetical protein
LVVVAVPLLALVIGGGAVAGWMLMRSDPFADPAERYFANGGDSTLSGCALTLDEASSGDELVRTATRDSTRTDVVEGVRQLQGLPEEASTWGWREARRFLVAWYSVCDSHRDEVDAWRNDQPSTERTNACRIELRTLKTAVEAFRAATGHYPASQDQVVGEFLVSRVDSYDFEMVAGEPRYTASDPDCPDD